jgi:hypothetical protein
MLVSGSFVFLLSTAGEVFQLLLSIGACTGLIYLLRWFWWRINAWFEIAAMAASLSSADRMAEGATRSYLGLLR